MRMSDAFDLEARELVELMLQITSKRYLDGRASSDEYIQAFGLRKALALALREREAQRYGKPPMCDNGHGPVEAVFVRDITSWRCPECANEISALMLRLARERAKGGE